MLELFMNRLVLYGATRKKHLNFQMEAELGLDHLKMKGMQKSIKDNL
jgi:hypothetical protein